MAQLARTDAPGHWSVYDKTYKLACGCGDNWRLHSKKQEESLAVLQEQSDEALSKGEVLNYIYSRGVADGSANYRIVSVKPLILQHIPFGDAYRLDAATIRGLRISDIQREMEFNRWWTQKAREQGGKE